MIGILEKNSLGESMSPRLFFRELLEVESF